jgi:hypothetical protein
MLYPIPNQNRAYIYFHGLNAAIRDPMPITNKIITIMWMTIIAGAPPSIASYFVKRHFTVPSRPKFLVRIMRMLRVLKQVNIS